jgi:flavin-dependent dehydrogenase
MVGDAARVIAPLAGDGIGMALQGAQLLGRLLERERQTARGHEALERSYRSGWDDLFKSRVRTAHFLQQILFSPQMRRMVSSLLTWAPSLLGMAVRMTREER